MEYKELDITGKRLSTHKRGHKQASDKSCVWPPWDTELRLSQGYFPGR